MPFLAPVRRSIVTAPPSGVIGFSDALTNVVHLQSLLARTVDGIGTYNSTAGDESLRTTTTPDPDAIIATTEATNTANILTPEPGYEWTDHIGLECNLWLSATTTNTSRVHLYFFVDNDSGDLPRWLFTFENNGDGTRDILLRSQEAAGSLTERFTALGRAETEGELRIEFKVLS